MAKKKRHYAVAVDWEDSQIIGRWHSVDQMPSTRNGLIRSVGFLMREDKNEIVIATSYDEENDNVSCVVAIPRSAIRGRITKLRT